MNQLHKGMPAMPLLSVSAWRLWRALQVTVWLIGAALLLALIFWPRVGLHAFWNVLIPVAPALIAIAPGLWRNICPMGSSALFARHMGWSREYRLSPHQQGLLALVGVGLLLLIVPLRHVILNTNGPATGLAIALLAGVAVLLSFRYQWKSAWCSGMCPVHPVEKLYGSAPIATPPNTHCHTCERCVETCPDSTPRTGQLSGRKGVRAQNIATVIMVGGFAGYVWGWFQVPDFFGTAGWRHLAQVYAWPFGGLAVTLALFLLLYRTVPDKHSRRVQQIFAAAAISCYYWYRLPALFGFGQFPSDGMLIDLSTVLPLWFPIVAKISATVFFAWWMVGRSEVRRAWLVRPPFVTSQA